jgi:hypothetical protein
MNQFTFGQVVHEWLRPGWHSAGRKNWFIDLHRLDRHCFG